MAAECPYAPAAAGRAPRRDRIGRDPRPPGYPSCPSVTRKNVMLVVMFVLEFTQVILHRF